MFIHQDQKTYVCDFCGKAQHEVEKMIAGPRGSAICCECIALCSEIVGHPMGLSAQEQRLVDVAVAAALKAAKEADAELVNKLQRQGRI